MYNYSIMAPSLDNLLVVKNEVLYWRIVVALIYFLDSGLIFCFSCVYMCARNESFQLCSTNILIFKRSLLALIIQANFHYQLPYIKHILYYGIGMS